MRCGVDWRLARYMGESTRPNLINNIYWPAGDEVRRSSSSVIRTAAFGYQDRGLELSEQLRKATA